MTVFFLFQVRSTFSVACNKKGQTLLSDLKEAATYSPTCDCSTIGVIGLNFSVRNGKRWNPNAITTQILN